MEEEVVVEVLVEVLVEVVVEVLVEVVDPKLAIQGQAPHLL